MGTMLNSSARAMRFSQITLRTCLYVVVQHVWSMSPTSSAIGIDYRLLNKSHIAFSALTLLVGQHKRHPACKKLSEWWDAGVVMCLGQGADLHIAQLMPLPLTVSCSSKSRLVLPSWFYLSGAGSPG